ncbi:uncharacterized protein LOC102681190 isoform X1 [Apis dorsata]|uniref:uncharacterized protein LOC102681190 isoform X1 n=1 Tax=Apis dorsata TaxID=7462 RepID=UPI0003DF6A43|nr:uncharacterized protein LOC102681190 isoform X1 [Apis dorsata]
MMRIKWIENILELKSKRTLEKRYVFPQIYSTLRYSITSKKNETIKNKNDYEDDDIKAKMPIKYSTSKASKFFSGSTSKNTPEHQDTVIITCFGIFLLYFCVLREENDIDEAMTKNIPPEILKQIYGK